MNGLRRAFGSPSLIAGGVLFGLIVVAALLAPVLAPYSPTAQDLSAGLLPPSAAHPFGTDQLGRDVLSRVLFAARTDLAIACAAAVLPCLVGVTVGLVSGYFGARTDWVLSRIADTVIAFPFYVLVIALVFAVGAGPRGIIVTFALVGWVGYARAVRALTASMREQGWVRAARGTGLSHARILARHVLPNVLPQVVVLLATEIVLIMVAIVTLGYLGLGIQPPTPDWGTMISDGQAFVTSHWWLSALPGLAVVITGIALSLLGDGLGDAMRVRPSGGGRAGRIDPAVAAESAVPAEPALPAEPAVPAESAARPVLDVRGLAVRLSRSEPGTRLVGGSAGLSFAVAPGGSYGIVGESGSGKSLTLAAVAGLLPESVFEVSGEVSVRGRIGMVFQDPEAALDPLSRVGTQLREACVAAGAPDPARRVRELIDSVRLPDVERIARAYPHELSGGQRQRIVIAMALASDPAVLLADEPTTALDVTVQREVLALLAELGRAQGLALVLVSHDLAVVASMCERIAVMRSGEIVEAGATDRVLQHPAHPYTRTLITAVPVLPERSERSEHEAVELQHAVPEPEPEPVLELREVSIDRGGRRVVHGVSFGLRGSLGLVGESGSGKTTLARAIVGELPLAAGSIEYRGAALRTSGRTGGHRTAIQLIPQDPASSLNPRMTAGQTLCEALGYRRSDDGQVQPARGRGARRRAVAELLREVGLSAALADAYPHELSGGQRQRVAIARALAVSPRVLIADEATSALDASVQAEMLALLGRLRDELGLALIVISHDLSVVHELCADVVVLRDGRIVEQGRDVLVHPATEYARELVDAVPRLWSPLAGSRAAGSTE